MDPNPVAARLIQAAQERGTILSAQLGSIVAKEFPEIRSDPDYPGLRPFIERFCGGRIVVHGEHGGDIVYRFADQGGTPSAASPQQAVTPWDAFQRPGVIEHLFVQRETGELRVSGDDVANADYVKVMRVTPEEHIAIASAFLSSLHGPDLEEGKAALSSSNYWPSWTKLVNKTTYRSSWAALRFDKLRDLFKARLVELGLSDTVVAASLRQLLAEKTEKHRANAATVSRGAELRARWPRDSKSKDIRQLVHAVIDTMGDGELRHLRLPLGEVLDALETFARK